VGFAHLQVCTGIGVSSEQHVEGELVTYRRRTPGLLALVLSALAATCTQTGAPMAPTGRTATATTAPAGADDATLKATQPAIVSPAPNAEVTESTVTFVMDNARGVYVDATLSVLVELWKGQPGSGTFVESTVMPQGQGQTSWTPDGKLEGLTEYSVRARATLNNAMGPWSSTVSFTTAALAAAVTQGAFDGDDIDPFQVVYLHRDISDWAKISTMSDVSITPGQICFDHTGAGQFPQSEFGDISVEGNVWVFAEFNGVWFGATWDWLRPGQVCKGESLEALGGEQIRIHPMDGSWVPAPGSTLCFAVSARARDEIEAGAVRTNIKCTVVP